MDKLSDLYLRRKLVLAALKIIRCELDSDPRAPIAEKRYLEQLEEIDVRIKELTGRPPDVVVGLAPANLFAKKL